MKSCRIIALSMLLCSCATSEAAVGGARPSTIARRGGGEVALVPPAGRLLLLDFFASWCVPCREALPQHAALAARYEGRVDFVLVSVDEDPVALEALLQRQPALPFPVGLDPAGRAAAAFEVRAMPTAVLLDAEGHERWRGAAYSEEALVGALEAAVASP